MRRRTTAMAMATAAAVVALTLGVMGSGGARATTGPAFQDGHGMHVASVTQLDARQYDVAVVPAALGRQVNIRMLRAASNG